MPTMSELKFTKDHEWVRLDGDVATVGITDHAQTALGDVVFVELPEVGREVAAGEACAVVESVKAASDIYAPIAGRIVEVNGALMDNPGLVNASAFDEGWFFRIEPADASAVADLMDETAYAAYLETL
jgi:glycine cleavage system H protein